MKKRFLLFLIQTAGWNGICVPAVASGGDSVVYVTDHDIHCRAGGGEELTEYMKAQCRLDVYHLNQRF